MAWMAAGGPAWLVIAALEAEADSLREEITGVTDLMSGASKETLDAEQDA